MSISIETAESADREGQPRSWCDRSVSFGMAKKPNYDFEKRKKELDRKKKKEDKRQDRLLRRQEGAADDMEEPAPQADGDPNPGPQSS